MALELKANSQYLAPRISTVVSGSGGVEPYVYSVVIGGVGGTIDSVTGKYTAPQGVFGIDTLRVTDAALDTFDLPMNVLSPLQLLAQIIQSELSLGTDRVWIFDQKIDEPIDQDMFVVLQILSLKNFANNRRPVVDGVVLAEDQSSSWKSSISIDIKSRSSEALDRKEEAVMALASQYSVQQQELNNFRIGRVPQNMVNLSEIDGAAIPYRFNITINVLYSVAKSKPVEYFDTFDDVEIVTDL